MEIQWHTNKETSEDFDWIAVGKNATRHTTRRKRLTVVRNDGKKQADRQRHALTNTQAKQENIIQVGKGWSQTDQGGSMRRGQMQKTRNSYTNT